MNPEQMQQAIDLLNENRYWALAALVIGLVVRLLKSDGPIPVSIPAKWRPWLALGLGALAGVCDKIGTGTPWKTAIGGGLISAFVAISGHQLLVESLRGGREIGQKKR